MSRSPASSPRNTFDRLVCWVRRVAESHPSTVLLALPLWPLGTALSVLMGLSLLSGENGEPATKADRRTARGYIFGGLIWPVVIYFWPPRPDDTIRSAN